MGGRIVAEVPIGLLAHHPLSFVNVEPGWRPTAPLARDGGTFDMAQLIRFALQPTSPNGVPEPRSPRA